MKNPASSLITYTEALKLALTDGLRQWPEMVLIGEGVPDPKGIFGTTLGLREQFGADRILDMPLAENGMTGVCIGAALGGLRPVMVHQRIDFALLAMDQMVNNAAKWRFMFNQQQTVPLVIRLIIGRGWGQGPQHSQSLQAMFAQIPGLKVVMPVTAQDAYSMMLAAIADDDPVLYIEHRWLHHIQGQVAQTNNVATLSGANVIKPGRDITIAAFSHMVIEALKAAEVLDLFGIDVEVVDMRCLTPLDIDSVSHSLKKTHHLVVADCAPDVASIGHQVIAKVACLQQTTLLKPPKLLAYPNFPVPTSPFMANDYYHGAEEIAKTVVKMLEKPVRDSDLVKNFTNALPKDVPDRSFAGPF